ncbi:hypothetical protein HDU78_000362 [Chytriomyces hyalinus]|nr:hypothetical protein HDU78_000362 [Chytriomyces hyalinus]KAJ3249705.1 hypothetical protein HDU77_007536 [Chytriomyces hyalinus]
MRHSLEIKIQPRKVFSEDLDILKSPSKWMHAFPASAHSDSSTTTQLSSPLAEQYTAEQDELPPLPPSTRSMKGDAKQTRRFSFGGFETDSLSSAVSAIMATEKSESRRSPTGVSMKQLAANVGKLVSPLSQKVGRFQVRTMTEKTHSA